MKELFYNVWWLKGSCWTEKILDHVDQVGYSQNSKNPVALTKSEAETLLRQLHAKFPWTIGGDYEVRIIVGAKKKKIIPDFPLDPTLHVLQAGYIQDRQRKRS